MKSGMSTRRSRIVLPTGSVGPMADARATRIAVLTTTVTPVYDDGKISPDLVIILLSRSLSNAFWLGSAKGAVILVDSLQI